MRYAAEDLLAVKSVARLISIGLACILVGLSLTGIYVTRDAADIAGQINTDQQLNGLYLRLDLAVQRESEIQLTYDITPTSSQRMHFNLASSAVKAQLNDLVRDSSVALELRRLARLRALQRRYLPIVTKYFAAVQRRDGTRAQILERTAILPVHNEMDRIIGLAVQLEEGEVSASLSALLRAQADLETATVIVFPVGLVLIGILWILHSYILRRDEIMRARVVNLQRDSQTDSVTDLRNHRAYQERVAEEVRRAERQRYPLSLALIDIDEFKLVNDQLGHAHGDRVLRHVGSLLCGARASDLVYRLGGDEFAIILPHTSEEDAVIALERIRSAIEEIVDTTTVSVGIAQLLPEERDPEILRERADVALYEAKRLGRNQVIQHEGIKGKSLIISAAKTTEVRRLLAAKQVYVAFQPICRRKDGSVFAYEALMRLPSGYALDGPQEAFDVADKLGRAAELDAICRDAILARARDVPADALLFCNLAPQSLEHPCIEGNALLEAVEKAGIAPERVIFEITERTALPTNVIIREARRLRTLGFKVALDDVGAGNAGLELLRYVSVDFIKIDRSVVTEALTQRGAFAVLASIVAFAHNAETFVIAEGIETQMMLDIIEHAGMPATGTGGVDGVQGYLLGRPNERIAEISSDRPGWRIIRGKDTAISS
jgi:diguanylate cyclase (GGDEF)-like protein